MLFPIGSEADGVLSDEEPGLHEAIKDTPHEYRSDDTGQPPRKHRRAVTLKDAEREQRQRKAGLHVAQGDLEGKDASES